MERINVYKDKASRWRWNHIAANGRIISDSGQGYSRLWSAKRAAKRVAPGVVIRVVR